MKTLDRVIQECKRLRDMRAGSPGLLYTISTTDLEATGEQVQLICRLMDDANLKPEEPVFVIRGQDKLSATCIWKYRNLAQYYGCKKEFKRELETTEAEFRKWQEGYSQFVRLPD